MYMYIYIYTYMYNSTVQANAVFLQVACRSGWVVGIPYAAITRALTVLGGASCSRLYKDNQIVEPSVACGIRWFSFNLDSSSNYLQTWQFPG